MPDPCVGSCRERLPLGVPLVTPKGEASKTGQAPDWQVLGALPQTGDTPAANGPELALLVVRVGREWVLALERMGLR
jgi:hypothetical protein